jgi:double stranded RNA-specific editase B
LVSRITVTVYKLIVSNQGLPSPFIFSRPVLSTITTPPDRLPAKSPKNSIIWINGWPEHEIVEISKGTDFFKFILLRRSLICKMLIAGKLLDGTPSRLSKRHFFFRFMALATTNLEYKSLVQKHVRNGNVSYNSLKKAAQAFGIAKEMLQSSFMIARLGQWVKKPLEQDSFEVPFDGSQPSDDLDRAPSPLGF